MTSKLHKKHLYFPDFGDASLAIKAWWAYQDKHNVKHTLFNISADGRDTDVSVSDKSLADQPKIIIFLRENYNGRFTVHNTPQVRTWLDEVFSSV